MPSLVWALLCRRVIIDAQFNLISYIDGIESLALPHFPHTVPAFVLCTNWIRTPGKDGTINMRGVVYSPSGEQLHAEDADPLELQAHHRRARVNLLLGGFSAPAPGTYDVACEVLVGTKWQEVARLPLDVVGAPSQTVAPRPEKVVARRRGQPTR